MFAMVLDGMGHPAVRRIAGIASRAGENVHQKLINLLLAHLNLGKYISTVPHGEATRIILLPSHMMHSIFSYNRDRFLMHFGANADSLSRFWGQLLSSDEGRELRQLHPYLKTVKSLDELRHTIPLVLHEDAGPFTIKKSTDLISWSALLGCGSDFTLKFGSFSYIKAAGMRKDCCAGAWQMFLDDSERLERGVLPDGSPFAFDPETGITWKATFLFGKGDGECLHLFWGLPGYTSSDECCGTCPANRSTRPHTDLRSTSPWRGRYWTNEEFLLKCRQGHPLTGSRLWNRLFARIDSMHALDCKGLMAIIAGGVLHKLLYRDAQLGATIAARFAKLNALLKTFNTTNRMSAYVSDIRPDNILNGGDWITLHGKSIKTAATRHICPFLVELTDEYCKGSEAFNIHARGICISMNNC